MDWVAILLTAVVTATVGAVIGGFIASEIGIRRTEKRFRRLIYRLLPDLKKAIQDILSDPTIRERARDFVDEILESVKRRGPEIVREVMKSASARSLSSANPDLPKDLLLEDEEHGKG